MSALRVCVRCGSCATQPSQGHSVWDRESGTSVQLDMRSRGQCRVRNALPQIDWFREGFWLLALVDVSMVITCLCCVGCLTDKPLGRKLAGRQNRLPVQAGTGPPVRVGVACLELIITTARCLHPSSPPTTAPIAARSRPAQSPALHRPVPLAPTHGAAHSLALSNTISSVIAVQQTAGITCRPPGRTHQPPWPRPHHLPSQRLSLSRQRP